MDLPKADEVYFAIAAMAPGFVILALRSQFVAGRLPAIKEGAIFYVMISVLYYSIVVPIFSMIDISGPLYHLTLYFFLPVVIGVVLGVSYQHQLVRTLARRMGLNIIHPAPSGWDLMFAQTRTRPWTWIIITTRDNEKIHGLMGGKSFASSAGTDRDLFIQRLADPDFNLVDREHGLWIRASDVKFVEVIPDE